MIFRRLPSTGPGYLAPVADEAGRTGRPPTDDGAEVTRGRYALGEFTITPRSALDDERPPGLLGGRYEVGRLIGSGGTARVYRSYDVRLNREVAVKIYDRDAVALDQRRRLREMTIQGSISHPGVVALLDSGTEHGRTYLVMQLVEGENLAERLLGGPMPAADVTALADGLAEALAHVHAQRIVHRDLKPANVFLSADGPLIGDFGIAHALDTTHITGTGLIPGTAAYLAPEQVSGEPAGPPADVYALGLILLECLTGQREYQGTMVEAAMARLTRPPRIPEDAPAALGYTLRRMTQREPADRPTAAKALDMLHAPPPASPWTRTERSPRWRRRSAAGAVAAGGVGAVAGSAESGGAAEAVAADSAGNSWPAAGATPIADQTDHGGPAEAVPAAGAAAAAAMASGADSAGYEWPAAGATPVADQADQGWPAGAVPGAGAAAAAAPTEHDRPGTAPGAGQADRSRPASGATSAADNASASHPANHGWTAARPIGHTQPLGNTPTRVHDVPPAPADSRRRRRLAVAGGLTAAAAAVVAAVLLVQPGSGTGTPSQLPGANSPAASSTPAASTPLAENGNRLPHPGSGGAGPQPGTSAPASLEPAAVTSGTPATVAGPTSGAPSSEATQPSDGGQPSDAGQPSKPGKPEKTTPPGQTKGKGSGQTT
ncbi:protein kinase domain-containing protein [Amycolatopsis sp. lyj-23]|uniref:serine/threonine-protein kinase n=1 Tax=Amycolatopsis sp. lyj-23 TaxID=2789283 RepID=UPI0039780ABC